VARLETVKGISDDHAALLRDKAGVNSISALLKAGSKRAGREKLAKTTGIDLRLILEWVHRADLMRVKGVGREYAGLLEEIGIDTVKELKHRVPENLYQGLQEVNNNKHLVRRLPTMEMVADWIEQASEIPPSVEY